MTKVFSKTSIKAISISLLFFFSSIGASVLINPAAAAVNSTPAATQLTALEANWAESDANLFNQNFNPQTQINSSNVQNLGLNWLFPLPTHPTALLSVAGGLGVDTAPMIINGTVYAITQYDQVFALNAANGDVIWTDVLPLQANSTAGHGTGPLSLHLHDGNAQFTTAMFNHTPTYWVAANDQKIYAINALNGKYELNFSIFNGVLTVAGNNPNSQYTGVGVANLLVDQNKGILISSVVSASSPASGRCFYRGWNILVSPPQLMWTAFCSPPQPGSNIPVNPNWDIQQVTNMTGAQIFYPGPAYHGGGSIPSTAVVDLKKLSASQLNATLYNDWGYQGQSAQCAAYTGGSSTGSTAAGWGAPWLLGTGPTAGMVFLPTNNRDPYNSPCTGGPNLWAASILALNETTGKWIWGFQTAAHEVWDLDCSWWQGLGNETVNGANTPVVWKLCKNGYLYELNALNGNLIWAYTPPVSSVPRCAFCDMLNPLNSTQMNLPFLNPSLQPTLMYPGPAVGESEASYNPTLNYIYFADENLPTLAYYVAPNSSNYHTNSGMLLLGPTGEILEGNYDNATLSAVNAATGQLVWTYFIPIQGYRGGVTNSGNVVYMTLSSGDLLMLNAQTGKMIRDYYIGGPLNVLPSVGATSNGQMEVIFPITAGIVTWATGVPGDIVAMGLQSIIGTTNTVTTTVNGGGGVGVTVTSTTTTTVGAGATSTVTQTVGGAGSTVTVSGSATTVTTTAASSGVSTTTYGIAAVAVIFIIATGYLAMRGRKPAS